MNAGAARGIDGGDTAQTYSRRVCHTACRGAALPHRAPRAAEARPSSTGAASSTQRVRTSPAISYLSHSSQGARWPSAVGGAGRTVAKPRSPALLPAGSRKLDLDTANCSATRTSSHPLA
eukprot:CAMPEP_0202756540 /NCGR_PEP_ID=MMETSP1388-20130828/15761_1 /ASSEMBLY_ACC=CAM_ASM_000864 /TAXON_ID=37098 /ORGANISM="Isochrysis sp, Strain CCMP1244" /LENGTH=119 /DNA_ID=CAMNT_0049424393 /DNA_START=38 /DNA_END=397 /DNA_ORIENTATION=-